MHKKVHIDDKIADFGFCRNHFHRKNEYFNIATSAAYCSMCVVEGLQKSGSVQAQQDSKNQLISLMDAYRSAKAQCESEDIQFSEKKRSIYNQLYLLKSRM